MSIISLAYTEHPKKRYIHDLHDVLNNATKFQLNQVNTKFFKLFDTALTLKQSRSVKVVCRGKA